MAPGDLAAVLSLQQQCYAHAFHEPHASFAAKLEASPQSCWVARGATGLLAYLVCLPVEGNGLPALHAGHWRRPDHPDWLYLHDLAIAPEARGSGISRALVGQACAWARAMSLPHLGLIAVQGSEPYWRKLGFAAIWPTPRVNADKLASFGPNAQYMQRPTPEADLNQGSPGDKSYD